MSRDLENVPAICDFIADDLEDLARTSSREDGHSLRLCVREARKHPGDTRRTGSIQPRDDGGISRICRAAVRKPDIRQLCESCAAKIVSVMGTTLSGARRKEFHDDQQPRFLLPEPPALKWNFDISSI